VFASAVDSSHNGINDQKFELLFTQPVIVSVNDVASTPCDNVPAVNPNTAEISVPLAAALANVIVLSAPVVGDVITNACDYESQVQVVEANPLANFV
jgi:hypothetical protein